jgi:hypothetical protein
MADTATPALAFDWRDPLHLDRQLSEDERMAAESARAYCQDKLFPAARCRNTMAALGSIMSPTA